ncbi:unnamed protein product [Amoebophrya sp. A25]|nr:unnamed protein product [Amoebophrya sp. A25]|eukprot:GSA25T00012402001.1
MPGYSEHAKQARAAIERGLRPDRASHHAPAYVSPSIPPTLLQHDDQIASQHAKAPEHGAEQNAESNLSTTIAKNPSSSCVLFGWPAPPHRDAPKSPYQKLRDRARTRRKSVRFASVVDARARGEQEATDEVERKGEDSPRRKDGMCGAGRLAKRTLRTCSEDKEQRPREEDDDVIVNGNNYDYSKDKEGPMKNASHVSFNEKIGKKAGQEVDHEDIIALLSALVEPSSSEQEDSSSSDGKSDSTKPGRMDRQLPSKRTRRKEKQEKTTTRSEKLDDDEDDNFHSHVRAKQETEAVDAFLGTLMKTDVKKRNRVLKLVCGETPTTSTEIARFCKRQMRDFLQTKRLRGADWLTLFHQEDKRLHRPLNNEEFTAIAKQRAKRKRERCVESRRRRKLFRKCRLKKKENLDQLYEEYRDKIEALFGGDSMRVNKDEHEEHEGFEQDIDFKLELNGARLHENKHTSVHVDIFDSDRRQLQHGHVDQLHVDHTSSSLHQEWETDTQHTHSTTRTTEHADTPQLLPRPRKTRTTLSRFRPSLHGIKTWQFFSKTIRNEDFNNAVQIFGANPQRLGQRKRV